MSELKKEFFMSQIKIIRDIKETEKIKISLVFYEETQSTCILRVCKNRDLSEVCKNLMEVKQPNIVVTYDYIYTADGDTYIIEEYISGRSIEEIIEEDGIFSEDDTAKIITKVCEGLELLHSLEPPLVHNDINTSNIMIKDDGSVKLFDFDISRLYRSGASRNTVLFGTEEYAAPEHFGYGQSEPRTDIYSIGVTMHRMLTGKRLNNEHKSTYHGSLKKIIDKCIQIAPERRYATVSLLKKDLNKYKNKTVMPVKNIALAIISVIALISGVAVWCNMVVDGAEDNHKNASNSYTGSISNETLKDIEEIETTISPLEIEGATGGVTGNTTTDITIDTSENESADSSENASVDSSENASVDSSENTSADSSENTTEDTIENTTEDTIENTTVENSTHIHRYIQKTVEATCTEKGYIEYTCSCGEQYINETPIKKHEYIANIIGATCTEDGYTIHTCACGDSYIDNVVEGKHDWTGATCENAKECFVCGTKEGEALGHDYERYVCTVCGEKDEEGYARAVNPEFCLKRGEYYTQVLTRTGENLEVTQILFEEDSNGVKCIKSFYSKEPIEGASGEALKTYTYNGMIYYKHWEEIHNEYTYKIDGDEDLGVYKDDGLDYYSFKFTIDGWMVDFWDSATTPERIEYYKYVLGVQFE